MKVTEEKKVFNSNIDSQDTIQYGISDIGFVLDLLRNKLYEDKVSAGVREYLSNARDAVREIGGSDKIEVHIPSYDQPEFSVRDYGPGLTPERISEVFCMYGSSTKRDTNKQVGGFGIGAKAAFAYTDNFTIESYCNGVKRTYASHLGDNKRGQIDLMSTENTIEKNGVRISYRVERNGISNFAESIIKNTMFWAEEEYPKFLNAGNYKQELDQAREIGKVRFMNTNLSGVRRNNYNDRANKKVIIDGIPYPMPEFGLTEQKQLELTCNSKDGGLNIFIPTGLLQVAASREKIEISEQNKKTFKEIVIAAKKDFEAARCNWDEQIVDVKTMLSANSNYGGFVLSSVKEFDHVTFKLGEHVFRSERSIPDVNNPQNSQARIKEILWRQARLGQIKSRYEEKRVDIIGKNKYYQIKPGAVNLNRVRDYISTNHSGETIEFITIEGLQETGKQIFNDDGSPKLDIYSKPIYTNIYERNEDTIKYCIEVLDRLGFVDIQPLIPKPEKKPRIKADYVPRKKGEIMLIRSASGDEKILTMEEFEKLEQKGAWVCFVGAKSLSGYNKYIEKMLKFVNINEVEYMFRVLDKHKNTVLEDKRLVEYSEFFNKWIPKTKTMLGVACWDTLDNESINILKNIEQNLQDHSNILYKASKFITLKDEVYSMEWDVKNMIKNSKEYPLSKAKLINLSKLIKENFQLLKYNIHKSDHNAEYINWGLEKMSKNNIDLKSLNIL